MNIKNKNLIKYNFVLAFILLLINAKYFEHKYIKVAYYCNSLRNGGIERVFSSLIHYLSKEKYFIFYLFTKAKIMKNEYAISNKTIRISLYERNINLYEAINYENIDILIYNYEDNEIEKLNKLNKTKVIFYNHSSFLYWIYQKQIYNFKDTAYNLYRSCKYVISVIPLENDYLFKKWGINSILMDNPSTYDYDSIIPSNLENNNIIMIGRGTDEVKRYELPIEAMKFIIKEIPFCQMNIVSNVNKKLQNFIFKLKLKNNVRFTGYLPNVEIYLKNSSLHILSSLSESYSMALGEAKIFGIPSILCGLDFLALAKGGTIIIYDDEPITIANEAIKILKNRHLRKKLGREARESMKKRKNKLIAKKWIKLLLSVYENDDEVYEELVNNKNKITDEEANQILNNQLKLLKKRRTIFKNITLEKFMFYSLT